MNLWWEIYAKQYCPHTKNVLVRKEAKEKWDRLMAFYKEGRCHDELSMDELYMRTGEGSDGVDEFKCLRPNTSVLESWHEGN